MKRIISITIIAFMLLNSLNASAQKSKPTPKPLKQGWALINLESPDLKPSDTLVLTTYGTYICGQLNSEQSLVTPDQYGVYHFKVPVRQIPQRFGISKPDENFSIAYFYAEDGDNIKLITKREKRGAWVMSFSGKGAAKYNCIFAGDTAKQMLVKRMRPRIIHGISKQTNGLIDSLVAYGLSVIDGVQGSVNPNVMTLIKAQLIGQSYEGIFKYLGPYLNPGATPAEIDHLKSRYNDLNGRKWDVTNVALAESPFYIRMLFERTTAGLSFDGDRSKPSVIEIYKAIRETYSGPFFDRLATQSLIGHPPDSDAMSKDYLDCLKDAVARTKDTTALDYLRRQLASYSKGVEAYPFALPDTSGKVYHLADFAGRVVLMDFWFTGCGPCKRFAELLDKEILPIYRNDPRIAFVNVNVDQKEDQWRQSVKSGIYTPRGSVSLFTEGKASAHPLIRHYNFNGYPQLVLLNAKGKIYSTSVPHEKEALLSLLQQALYDGN